MVDQPLRFIFLSPGHPVYDLYPSGGGGIQSQIYGLAKALSRRGHDVYIVKRRPAGPPPQLPEDAGIRYIDVDAPFADDVASVLLYSLGSRKAIEALEPDFIYMAERFSAYFISGLKYRKAFKVHNYDALTYYRDFSTSYRRINHGFFWIKREIERRVLSKCRWTFAATESLRAILQSEGISNTVLLRNAVDADLYSDQGDGGYVLYAGRFDKVKGLDLLIGAFKDLRIKDGSRLVLVGRGPDELRLKEVAGPSSGITFMPWRWGKALREVYSRCSVFVLPSYFETFGNALLEAMACSKPVIASRIPGPTDLVKDGVDGHLFTPGDIDDLKEKLGLLLSDTTLRRRLGREARRKVESAYTFERESSVLEGICSSA